MSEAEAWQAPARATIAWRRFDDEVVVYEEQTGSTHHLAPLASALLVALIEHPGGLSSEALLRSVAAEEQDRTDDLAAEVQRALARLAELKLATRIRA